MQPWAALVIPLAALGKQGKGPPPLKRTKTVDEAVKKDLIMILLEVYMSGGCVVYCFRRRTTELTLKPKLASETTADRTARLLNSQAMNLEVLDVVAKLPPEWPLRVLSTFVSRSLRRTLHARHEGQIVKAISQGQNLAVAESTWAIVREQGMVIEEPLSGDEGEEDEEGEKLGLDLGERVEGQPASFNEKAGLHHEVAFADDDQRNEVLGPGEDVVDISVSPPSHPYNVGP